MADNIGDRSSNNDGCIKEQDMRLPIAIVGRIMKRILPRNAKISKEAKETVQECASEFICFVTSEASNKCKKEKRSTVSGDDICWAFGVLGFDDYWEPLKRYLDRYRELEGDRSSNQEKINTTSEEKDEPSNSSYGRSISTSGEASSSATRSKTVQNSNTHSISRRF